MTFPTRQLLTNKKITRMVFIFEQYHVYIYACEITRILENPKILAMCRNSDKYTVTIKEIDN
jgi:hypothetical protein